MICLFIITALALAGAWIWSRIRLGEWRHIRLTDDWEARGGRLYRGWLK